MHWAAQKTWFLAGTVVVVTSNAMNFVPNWKAAFEEHIASKRQKRRPCILFKICCMVWSYFQTMTVDSRMSWEYLGTDRSGKL